MCYITMKMNISSLGGMAELADAAGSKSAEVHPSWGFDSPSRLAFIVRPIGCGGCYFDIQEKSRQSDKKLCHCCMMGVFHGHSAGLESVPFCHRDNFRSVVIGHPK